MKKGVQVRSIAINSLFHKNNYNKNLQVAKAKKKKKKTRSTPASSPFISGNIKGNQIQVQPRLQSIHWSCPNSTWPWTLSRFTIAHSILKDSTKAAAVGGSLKPAGPSRCLPTRSQTAGESGLHGLPFAIIKTWPSLQHLHVWFSSNPNSYTLPWGS